MAYESEHSKKVKALVRAILDAHGVTDEPTEADIELVEDFGDDRWESGMNQSGSLLANPPL